MQVKVDILPENYEQTLVDKVAQTMFVTFNEGRDINMTVIGAFSIPYGYAGEIDPNKQYFCEKVVTFTDGPEKGQSGPEIFEWRNWGRSSQLFITKLNEFGYEVKLKEETS